METVVKAITKTERVIQITTIDKAKTPDNEPPILTLSANNPIKVVEDETITFRVKAKMIKIFTLEATEFLAKYFKRYNVGTTGVVSSRYENTEKEKETTINTTYNKDVGKQKYKLYLNKYCSLTQQMMQEISYQ